MALKVKATSGEPRELVPPGTYKAVVVGIYDIGTHSGQYGSRHQLIMSWELHKKGLERPYLISKFYGLSFNTKSSLRKDVESLLGKSFRDGEEFNLEALVERPCRVQIIHGKRQDGTARDEIKSLMPLDEDDMNPPEAAGNTCYFEISGTRCEIPSEVPSFIAERIKLSPEWLGKPTGAETYDNGRTIDTIDDIPF